MSDLFGTDPDDPLTPRTEASSWFAGFSMLGEAGQADALSEVEKRVKSVLSRQSQKDETESKNFVSLLLLLTQTSFRLRAVTLLLDCAFYYSRIGRSPFGKHLAYKVLLEVLRVEDEAFMRRAHNLLGVMQMEAADYQASLSHLESALTYAYRLNDPLQTIPCLANAVATLIELGHYNDAVSIAISITDAKIEHPIIKSTQFQTATNGLFCAHRMHNAHHAYYFLSIGNDLLDCVELDPVMRATYEHHRALYLIDTFDHETAEELIVAARRDSKESKNPRIDILLRIPEALCEWASRADAGIASGRKKLRDLYQVTKQSKLYHDDVLRALMKAYGNAMDNEAARLGMKYAKELVEFTTSVKRAKFYRQLSDRGVSVRPEPPRLEVPFDPFANVRQWLALSNGSLPEGKTSNAVYGPDTPKKVIAKHDELTAIHDDIARLRTEAILKEIRTVAYDTAENWAIAAEFFDDQTGQHCFRVGYLAGMLAREIGLEPGYCARIEHAARLHDIGKIGVNEMILLKPGPLDPSELTAMRAHAEVGAFMLAGALDPVLQMAAVIAKHHHEWWNGAGYPSALADRRIPLAARICALADVYDALTHARPYKGAWPHRVAVEEMLNLAGVQFDPHLIRPFLRVLEKYVPALAAGRLPGLDHLKSNGLIASRKKLLETIGAQS